MWGHVDIPCQGAVSFSSSNVFVFDEVKVFDCDQLAKVAEDVVYLLDGFREVVFVVSDDASDCQSHLGVMFPFKEGSSNNFADLVLGLGC